MQLGELSRHIAHVEAAQERVDAPGGLLAVRDCLDDGPRAQHHIAAGEDLGIVGLEGERIDLGGLVPGALDTLLRARAVELGKLASGDNHLVAGDHELGARDRHRPEPARSVGPTELMALHLDAGHGALAVEHDAHRHGQRLEPHALFEGGVDLVGGSRHLVAGAAAQAGDLFGALADRDTAGFDGGEAVAHDRHPVADAHVAGELELGEKIECGDHAVGLFSGDAQGAGAQGSETQEDRVVRGRQVVHAHIDAQPRVALQLDSHAPQDVQLLVEHVARQAEGRNAVPQHATRFGERLEDRDVMTLEPGVEGAGETGGAGAQDRDAFAAVGLGIDRQEQFAGLLVVEALVCHEAMQPADGDRLVDQLPPAGTFAGTRADATQDGRERQVFAQLAHAGLVVAVGDGVEELRDLDVGRTGVAARRRAEGVVVGQDQLEVKVAHAAHLLGIGEHDHAVESDRLAARHGASALELDHADAAGARRRQPWFVAERRDVDADPRGRLENGLAAVAGRLLTVDGECDLRHAWDRRKRRRSRVGLVACHGHAPCRPVPAASGLSRPDHTFTASKLQTWRQVSHLMQRSSSITWIPFFSPVMA